MDPDSLCPDVKFIEQMGSLLDDDEHCDVTFFVGPSKTEVKYCCSRMIFFSLSWKITLFCFHLFSVMFVSNLCPLYICFFSIFVFFHKNGFFVFTYVEGHAGRHAIQFFWTRLIWCYIMVVPG